MIKNNLIWQKSQWQRLQGLRAQLPHALLFRGQKGIGKLHLAKVFAKGLLCESSPENGEPCGNCISCNWFEQGNHPDYRLVQPEALAETDELNDEGEGETPEASEGARKSKKPSTQIKIDQIRGLAEFVAIGSHRQGAKIVIVHPAEAMNNATANALLKSLEEPPAGVLFILVAHQPARLLPTILSRCQQVAFSLPETGAALAWLKEQGVKGAETALAQASFAPLEAARAQEESLAEQQRFIENMSGRDGRFDALAVAETFAKIPPPVFIGWMQKWVHDLALCSATGDVRYHPGQAATIEKISRSYDFLGLIRYARALAQHRRVAEHPLNPRLLFEDILLSFPRPIAK